MPRGLMTPGLSLPLGQRVGSPGRMFAPGGDDGPSYQILIQDITFRSDHDMLTDYDADWKAGGIRYSKPEWSFYKRAKAGNPVSHSMSESIELELTVGYHTWNESPPKPVELVGRAKVKNGATTEKIELKTGSVVLKPGSNTVTATSKTGFPAVVQKLDLEIEWEIIGKGLKRDPADESTPIYAPNVKSTHEVLVTLGKPETVDPTDKGKEKKAATYKRMAYAVETVGALKSTDPHTIVEKILKGFSGFSLGTLFDNSWQVADNKNVDCRTIVQYITDVIKMVGCPGKAKVVLVFPRLKNKSWPGKRANIGARGEFLPALLLSAEPKAADFEVVAEPPAKSGNYGGLDRPALIHPNGKAKAILFDRHGGQNVFEGCLLFDHGGKTRYYGGGAGVYASKELVLSEIFQSFSWGVLDIGDPTTEKDDHMVPDQKIMPPWPAG